MAADITPFIKDAQRLQDQTGIPASITLGQIILESSGSYKNGLSSLAANAKNLFGVKGTGNGGTVIMPTNEVSNGRVITTQAGFRKYNSYYDSMLDHAKVLSAPRYQTHLKNAKSINEYAKGIKAGGYATDPNYSNKLLNIIGSYDLHKYDTGNMQYTPIAGGTSNSTTSKDDSKSNMIESIFTQVVRVIALLTVFILMIIFFMRAFPAVEDTATSVMPQTKALKAVKKLTK